MTHRQSTSCMTAWVVRFGRLTDPCLTCFKLQPPHPHPVTTIRQPCSGLKPAGQLGRRERCSRAKCCATRHRLVTLLHWPDRLYYPPCRRPLPRVVRLSVSRVHCHCDTGSLFPWPFGEWRTTAGGRHCHAATVGLLAAMEGRYSTPTWTLRGRSARTVALAATGISLYRRAVQFSKWTRTPWYDKQ